MMKNNATEHPRGWRRRMIGALGALVIAASALALTASAASATMACHYPEGSNTCLTITPLGNRWYAVKIGIDVYMPPEEAQALIIWASHCPQFPPCTPFSARLWGEDGSSDPGLFAVPVSWVQAWDGGLSAEFDIAVHSRSLNEDSDGRDEIYATVDMTDYRTGHIRFFRSGLVVGYWSN